MSKATHTQIALSDLHIDPLNARKIGVEADPILTASIAAHGLLLPLIVRKNASGYGVIAGGKRFASLMELHKADPLACMVPVIITDRDDASALEASLAENVARVEMHQVDEFRAYTALANDKDNPQTPEQIAKRFGITVRQVEQRLALGNLDPTVLKAFVDEKLGVEAIRAFTLIPDVKVQRKILAKIASGEVYPNAHTIRHAAIGNAPAVGKYFGLIREADYEARGGKITRDLFGDNHIVSDPALVTTMVNELLEAKCKELLADGWKWATSEVPGDFWRYNRVSPKVEPTKAEAKELKRLEQLISANEEAEDFDQERDDAADAASDAHDKLMAEISARGFTPQIKAKAGCYVSINHKGDGLELDFRYEPRAEPKQKAEAAKKAEAKAKLPVADTVSNALMVRLGDAMTNAAQTAIVHQPNVALATLLAGLISNEGPARITRSGMGWNDKRPKFEAALRDALKLSLGDLAKQISIEVAKSLVFADRAQSTAPLATPERATLAHAIDGKKLTAALREKFDAKDYFESVSRAVIVDCVREAMGDDHAANVAKMDKAAAAKFAVANLPKTKWLPKQLRVPGYDGPASKPAKAKTPAKTAKR